jgi:hypothetical protein
MSKYRKALVALGGLVVQIIPALSLHGTAEKVAAIVLAALTALGVHAVPNDAPTPPSA